MYFYSQNLIILGQFCFKLNHTNIFWNVSYVWRFYIIDSLARWKNIFLLPFISENRFIWYNFPAEGNISDVLSCHLTSTPTRALFRLNQSKYCIFWIVFFQYNSRIKQQFSPTLVSFTPTTQACKRERSPTVGSPACPLAKKLVLLSMTHNFRFDRK
jgi:hypothetical protein